MRQLVILAPGLSHRLLELIPAYHPQAELAFSFCPEPTQRTALGDRAAGTFCPAESMGRTARFFYLLRLIGSKSCDAVFVHGTDSAMVPALAAARLAGVPRVIACAHAGGAEPLRPLPRRCFHRAAADSRRLSEALFGGVAAIVPDGIAPGDFPDKSMREAWRAALGIEDKRVYLQAARFSRAAEYDHSLDLFHRVLRERPDARLLCVGQGPLRSEIMARVEYENLSDFVLLPGDADRLSPLLMAADVFWMPGKGDGGVLAAAQAAGLPCLLGGEISAADALTETGLASLDADPCGPDRPWERRLAMSREAHRMAEKSGRTAAAVGRTLSELAETVKK